MQHATRNNAPAGAAVLLGAALAAFAASQDWATMTVSMPVGRLADAAAHPSLGFDRFIAPGGEGGDVQAMVLWTAAVVGLAALLLLMTRVRGLGVAWRLVALMGIAVLGLLSFWGWQVVGDPASVLAAEGTIAGQAAGGVADLLELVGVVTVSPGPGLWLLTAGCVIATIGALIPAGRAYAVHMSPGVVPAGHAPGHGVPMPGWYPDQADGSMLRWFDGARWTGHIRPKG